jgi:hypothetical protein
MLPPRAGIQFAQRPRRIKKFAYCCDLSQRCQAGNPALDDVAGAPEPIVACLRSMTQPPSQLSVSPDGRGHTPLARVGSRISIHTTGLTRWGANYGGENKCGLRGVRIPKHAMRNSEVMVLATGKKAAWLTIKRSLITIYNDVYDEHLFVFAAGLSYYFVLSLFRCWFQWRPC